MNKIVLNDVSRVTDEFFAFMLGLDDAVERVIIRYLFDHSGWISFQDIKQFVIIDTMICGSERRLSSRLASLLAFKIIDRKVEPDNRTFYKLDDEFIKDLLEKKEKSY